MISWDTDEWLRRGGILVTRMMATRKEGDEIDGGEVIWRE